MFSVLDNHFLLRENQGQIYLLHLLVYLDDSFCRSCNHVSSYLLVLGFVDYDVLFVYRVKALNGVFRSLA